MKHKVKYKPKISSGNSLVLEECEGIFSDLETVETTKKKDTIKQLRANWGDYFLNPAFSKLKNELIDLAICTEVNKKNYKEQDVDNIQNCVFDALAKDENDPSWNYLIENDRQIARVLVIKLPRKEIEGHETEGVCISFRKHNLKKQMIVGRKRAVGGCV